MLLAILNIIIIILLTVLGFIGRRLFMTNDKQYEMLNKINEFIHKVDKRLIKIETLNEFNNKDKL